MEEMKELKSAIMAVVAQKRLVRPGVTPVASCAYPVAERDPHDSPNGS